MDTNGNLLRLKTRLDELSLSYEIIPHKPILTVEEGLKELCIEAAD